jgi:hypothetical protein
MLRADVPEVLVKGLMADAIDELTDAIIPRVQSDVMKHGVSTIKFNKEYMDPMPWGGVPRLLTFDRSHKDEYAVHNAVAIQIPTELLDTPEGVDLHNKQLRNVEVVAMRTLHATVLDRLYNVRNTIDLYRNANLFHTLELPQVLAQICHGFALWSKYATGPKETDMLFTQLAERRQQDPDWYILPAQAKPALSGMTHPENQWYMTSGARGPTRMEGGINAVTTLGKKKCLFIPESDAQLDMTNALADPWNRLVAYGKFYHMCDRHKHVERSKLPPNHMNLNLYCESRDKKFEVGPAKCLLNCGRFNPEDGSLDYVMHMHLCENGEQDMFVYKDTHGTYHVSTMFGQMETIYLDSTCKKNVVLSVLRHLSEKDVSDLQELKTELAMWKVRTGPAPPDTGSAEDMYKCGLYASMYGVERILATVDSNSNLGEKMKRLMQAAVKLKTVLKSCFGDMNALWDATSLPPGFQKSVQDRETCALVYRTMMEDVAPLYTIQGGAALFTKIFGRSLKEMEREVLGMAPNDTARRTITASLQTMDRISRNLDAYSHYYDWTVLGLFYSKFNGELAIIVNGLASLVDEELSKSPGLVGDTLPKSEWERVADIEKVRGVLKEQYSYIKDLMVKVSEEPGADELRSYLDVIDGNSDRPTPRPYVVCKTTISEYGGLIKSGADYVPASAYEWGDPLAHTIPKRKYEAAKPIHSKAVMHQREYMQSRREPFGDADLSGTAEDENNPAYFTECPAFIAHHGRAMLHLDPAKRSIELALLFTDITLQAFMSMLDNNVQIPCSFLLMQPNVTRKMASGLCLKAGRETGYCVYGNMRYKALEASYRSMYWASFEMTLGCFIVNEDNVMIADNILFGRYLGGGNLEFMTLAEAKDLFRNNLMPQEADINRNSMLVAMCSYTEDISNWYIDIRGRYSLGGNGMGLDDSQPLYSSAAFYNLLWGMDNLTNMVDYDWLNFQRTPSATGLLFQEYLEYVGMDGNWVRQLGRGPDGEGVVEGNTGPVRNGRAVSVLHPSSGGHAIRGFP